ncbi:MAG: hypothetical protein K5644_05695, partial [Lachnospiraceae bacterium]|nr:hypothetical protein [Lachnospiraceae bacterium]
IGVLVIGVAAGVTLAILKLGLFAKPFVEENEITISSPVQTFSVPIEWFGIDSNKNIVNVPAMTVEAGNAKYRLYDYKVEDENDDNVTVSFKCDVETTCKGSIPTANIPKNLYTLNYLYPTLELFDYYTGDILSEVGSFIKGDYEKDYKYSDVKWKGKTYRIGTKIEKDVGTFNPTANRNGDGTTSINVNAQKVFTYYVNMPKDYDGLMLSLFKQKYTQGEYTDLLSMGNTYNELSQQAELYGNESQELVDIKDRLNKTYKMNQSFTYPDRFYNFDDFYVVRASEIPKN